MKYIFNTKIITFLLIALGTVIFTVSLNPNNVSAAVDTCTWTGTADSNTANASNWSGCDNGNLPEDGDIVIFPASATNKTVNNDSTTVFYRFNVQGGGYTFSGNTILIANDFSATDSSIFNVGIEFVETLNADPKSMIIENVASTFNESITISAPNSKFDFEVQNTSVDYDMPHIIGEADEFVISSGQRTINSNTEATTFDYNNLRIATTTYNCQSNTCFGESDAANTIHFQNSNINFNTAGNFDFDQTFSSVNMAQLTVFNIIVDDVHININGALVVNSNIEFHLGSNMDVNSTLSLHGGIDNDYDLKFSNFVSGDKVKILTNPIIGSGSLTVNSGLISILVDSPNYDGEINLNSGSITINSEFGLGSTIGKTKFLSGNNSLEIDELSLDFFIQENFEIYSTGHISDKSPSLINFVNNFHMINSNANVRLNFHKQLSDSALFISGSITGTGDVSFSGFNNGTIGLRGPLNNSYEGKTTIGSGINVFLDKDSGSRAMSKEILLYNSESNKVSNLILMFNQENLDDDSIITFESHGNPGIEMTVNLYLYSNIIETIGGIRDLGQSGNIILGSNSHLIINQTTDSTFGGKFYTLPDVDIDSSYITKTGNGKLILTGIRDTELSTGTLAMLIDQGIVQYDGDFLETLQIIDTDAIVQGTGKTGSALVGPDGVIAPGHSPGCLDAGYVNLSFGGIIRLELNGTNPCTDYDQLRTLGIDLENGQLEILLGYAPTIGTQFTIITTSDTAPENTFLGLANNAEFTVDGTRFRINYLDRSVVLTVIEQTVPETLLPTGSAMYASVIGGTITLITSSAAAVMYELRRRK